ncbi:phosphatase PAP2 family protein [Dysgonomonas sp. ZJ709]|uniref:phosphatase PAP2 family protein n=1 Tax=Dysgonomonas sp. ZJ709 TaxID=2709797 RepID=UPI0013E9F5F1|nr:phosphatase PAP2 family protein [Dysgonomonas sp. ZJ709]
MRREKEPVLAQAISIIAHPLFMATYGVCFLFLCTSFGALFAGQSVKFLLPVFLLSCVVPAISIFFMKQAGLVKDYDLRDRHDRLLPFLVSILSHALLFYYFFRAGLYPWFIATLAAPLILLIMGAIITLYWKISAHMLGIGGLIGSILSVCYNVNLSRPNLSNLLIILFILAGCLGVSRLVLKRHTPAQVYAGFCLGLVISYTCVWFGANLKYIF